MCFDDLSGPLVSIWIVTFFLNVPTAITYFRCKEKLIRATHILYGLFHVARTGSVYVTIAVTVERYFAVVHPTKEFKMKVLLLPFAITFAALYNIPKVILEKSHYQIVSLSSNENRSNKISKYQFFYSFLSTSQNPFLIKPVAQMIPSYAKQTIEWIHIMPLFMFFGAT